MHVFTSLVKFSQLFFYHFIKLATVFVSMLFFKKVPLKIFDNTIIPRLHQGGKRLQCNLDFMNKIEGRSNIEFS